MAYTTCTFWIKFFIFWFAISGLMTLLTQFCPSGYGGIQVQCLTINMFISVIICSPILFANQIYFAVCKGQKKTNQNVSLDNKSWIRENLEQIRSDYENKFIAVQNNEIIDYDSDLATLKERVQYFKSTYIQFINPREVSDVYDKLVKKK